MSQSVSRRRADERRSSTARQTRPADDEPQPRRACTTIGYAIDFNNLPGVSRVTNITSWYLSARVLNVGVREPN